MVGGVKWIALNYVHQSGATLEVEINNAGNSDLLDITGTATINGGDVSVVPVDRVMGSSREYTFMTAAGGITGDFGVDSPAVLSCSLEKRAGDTEYWLLVDRLSYASQANTNNQTGVAGMLDAMSATATGSLLAAMGALDTLGQAALVDAYDQFAGDIYGSLAVLSRQNCMYLYEMLAERIRADLIRPNGGCACRCCGRFSDNRAWDGWISGYGRGGNAQSDGNAHGVNYSVGGTTAVIERRLDPRSKMGFFYNYGRANVNTTGGLQNGADIDQHHWGGFLTSRGFSNYVTLAGGLGHDDFETVRHISLNGVDEYAAGCFNGWNSSVYAEIGRCYGGDGASFQPFAALQYIYVRQHDLAESGAGTLNLNVGGVDLNGLQTTLGGRFAMVVMSDRLGQVELDAHALWTHELLDEVAALAGVQLDGVGPVVGIRGLDVGRDWFVFTPGATWNLSDRCRLFARYNLTVNSQLAAHTGSGGLELVW